MFFQGRALWHSSVAVHSIITGRAKPVSQWTDKERRAAAGAVAASLAGVGDLSVEDHIENGDLALHVRRATNAPEEAGVRLIRAARGRPAPS